MTDHAKRAGRPRLWTTLAVAALVVSLAACGDRKVAETPPEKGDVAVARVDGKAVWSSDVKREAVAQGLIGEGEPLDLQSDLFRQVLDEVVDQKLLAAEAVKRKLDKDPLAQRRLMAAHDRVLGDILVDSEVNKSVTENGIQSLYREQLKLARQSEEMKARQIVAKTQADAEAIKKLLTTGASFEALAMERSTDTATRFNGGDFGGYFTLDVMPEPYQAALKDAPVNQIIGPFPVEGGFALVRVEEKRQEAPITIEAARPQIVRFLTYDRVRELLENLRGGAKVELLLPKTPPVPGAPQEPATAPATVPPVNAPAPATPTPQKK